MPGIYSLLPLVSDISRRLSIMLILDLCSISTHQPILREKGVFQVERDDSNEYPYRSHGQPLLAYLAFAGCLFLLVVAGGAALWNGFHLLPFVAPYLTVRRYSYLLYCCLIGTDLSFSRSLSSLDFGLCSRSLGRLDGPL